MEIALKPFVFIYFYYISVKLNQGIWKLDLQLVKSVKQVEKLDI